jgi:RNA polymerase sigma-70 factor (ECF subfamily)
MASAKSDPGPEDREPVLPAWQGAMLLRRIGEGDESAFESFYRLSSDRFYSLTIHWVRDEQLAREIVQDCYMRIWKIAKRYDPVRSAPFTWSCMILRGICLDHLRKNKRNPLLLEDHDLTLDLTAPMQVDDLLFHQSVASLHHAFSELTEDERSIVNAALFDPRTVRQLAEYWKTPLPTVKTRIRRAMIKLRDLIRATSNLIVLL